MTTQDFMIILFCTVDQEMLHISKRPNATLYPSAVVPLALLYALKGGGTRAFYRWLRRDSQALCPQVPERTRLCRLCTTPSAWTAHLLAAPMVLGVADTYDMEFIPPMRTGWSPAQMGKQGQSNYRWLVWGTRCFIVPQWGLICAWDCATAHVYDTHLQPLMAPFADIMIVLTDTGFHATTGDPPNMPVWLCGTRHTRMVVATVLVMLTTVCHCTQRHHRVWAYCRAHGAWIMAVFNLLAQWTLEVDDHDMLHFSIAALSL
jgi:hypothetical protein